MWPACGEYGGRALAKANQVKTSLRIGMAILASAQLQAADFRDEFWPEAKVYIKTGETHRIYLQASGTRSRADGYKDGQLGAHLDFYFTPLLKHRPQRHPDTGRNKMLMIRTGYYFSQTPTGSQDPSTEHTPAVEFTPRFYLPKLILVENRFRGDFRFVNGLFMPRFRYRVRVERTFKMVRSALTPYTEFEAFYDWRYNAFHRQRYSSGIEWVLSKRFAVEGYYLRQQDSKSSQRGTDVAGLVLHFYFR
jgi:hypothetical protein